MKIAKEKVWATIDGKLVADGDPNAATLVAIPGQPVPDERLKDYSNAGSFFKDANFDSKTGELVNDVKPAKSDTAGPKPQNRESEIAPTTRAVTSARKTSAAKKTSGK